MGNILNIINSDKDFYDTHNGHYMRCAKGAFYSSELKENFKVNEVDIDNIDENTNYIYLIECVTQDAVYSGIFKLPPAIAIAPSPYPFRKKMHASGTSNFAPATNNPVM